MMELIIMAVLYLPVQFFGHVSKNVQFHPYHHHKFVDHGIIGEYSDGNDVRSRNNINFIVKDDFFLGGISGGMGGHVNPIPEDLLGDCSHGIDDIFGKGGGGGGDINEVAEEEDERMSMTMTSSSSSSSSSTTMTEPVTTRKTILLDVDEEVCDFPSHVQMCHTIFCIVSDNNEAQDDNTKDDGHCHHWWWRRMAMEDITHGEDGGEGKGIFMDVEEGGDLGREEEILLSHGPNENNVDAADVVVDGNHTVVGFDEATKKT